jgi:CRP-like cAMP-binding protein
MTDNAKLFAEGMLKGFAPEEAEVFLNQCEEKTYADGANLFMEQTEATRLYLIVAGGIDLHFEMPRRENADTTVASLRSGDAIGWSAIVPPYRYRLSGYCKGKTTLLEIDREALQEIFESNYRLAYIFMRNIAVLTGERLHHVQDKLAKVLADEAVNGW